MELFGICSIVIVGVFVLGETCVLILSGERMTKKLNDYLKKSNQ